jgi:hypothetical protein
MDKRYPPKQTRDIPTSKTSRPKSFDAQRSSLQPKDAEPSRPQSKPEAARASPSNPNDLKQTRDIPTSKTSRPKSFDVQRSSLQPKDAEPSRPQSKQNPLKRTESIQAVSSNPKDLKSKQGKHSASRPHDAILQVNQTIWKKQPHSDHGASNSRQRQNSSAQLDWQQATLRHSSRSSLGGRSFNPSLRRKIHALAGGGDPEETSKKEETSKNKEVSESQTKLTNEEILALYPSPPRPTTENDVWKEVYRPSMDEVWDNIQKNKYH